MTFVVPLLVPFLVSLLAPFLVSLFVRYCRTIGLKPPGKLGSQLPARSLNAGGKADKSTDALGIAPATDDKLVLDPLGIAGMPMTLGSQQEPLADMDQSLTDTSEAEGDKAGTSQVRFG